MTALNIVGVSGGLSVPSRTLALVELAVDAITQAAPASMRTSSSVIDIGSLRHIGLARSRADVLPEEEQALRAVENADLLVVGTPVYKGSYTGLFKHFVDLLEYRSLIGTPVALLAIGGSDRHALVIEHQLRPLFAFFQAQPLGTGLFVSERELVDGRFASVPAQQRFDRLVEEAARAAHAHLHQHPRLNETAA